MLAFFKSLGKFLIAPLLLAAPLVLWHRYGGPSTTPAGEIGRVAENYVKALYSRDFASSYRWLSARDRDAKSQATYVKEQGSFTGFTFQLANKLASFVEVTAAEPIVSGDRATLSVSLKLPDAEKLAPLVLHWQEDKLNALSSAEQNALLTTIAERKRQAEIPFTQARENFDLVKENNQWKIFLNWQSGVKVEVKMKLPDGTALEVTPVNSQIVFQPGEPFTIALKLKNKSNRELRARLVHNVEPKSLEKYLGVGDCGNFVPFRLAAGKQDENRSTFLVWTNLPAEIKRFTMIYEFEVDTQTP
jgi:hypothetical protein